MNKKINFKTMKIVGDTINQLKNVRNNNINSQLSNLINRTNEVKFLKNISFLEEAPNGVKYESGVPNEEKENNGIVS